MVMLKLVVSWKESNYYLFLLCVSILVFLVSFIILSITHRRKRLSKECKWLMKQIHNEITPIKEAIPEYSQWKFYNKNVTRKNCVGHEIERNDLFINSDNGVKLAFLQNDDLASGLYSILKLTLDGHRIAQYYESYITGPLDYEMRNSIHFDIYDSVPTKALKIVNKDLWELVGFKIQKDRYDVKTRKRKKRERKRNDRRKRREISNAIKARKNNRF